MRVSDSYVSTVIILVVFATRKSTLSLRVVVSCFSFDGRIHCMTHRRLGLHETSLRIP